MGSVATMSQRRRRISWVAPTAVLSNEVCVCLRRHIKEASVAGLSKDQLTAKLADTCQPTSSAALTLAALDVLLEEGVVCWAAGFDQEVLIATSLIGRLTSGFQGSLAEADRGQSGPVCDFQSLAGLQAAKASKAPTQTSRRSSVPRAVGSNFDKGPGGGEGTCLLRPWLDHEGQLNEAFWSGLTQKVLSVVMRNPGE